MWALSRHWNVTPAGAAIGSMAYAFGGTVLFQYCNVIFLVGAAWLPWGLRAADRLVRSDHRGALPELAAVLALQVLGGDAEAAYLTAVCAAGYACWVHRSPRTRSWPHVAWGFFLAVFWIAAVLTAAHVLLRTAASRTGPRALGATAGQVVIPALWVLIALGVARRWRRRQVVPPAGRAVLAVVDRRRPWPRRLPQCNYCQSASSAASQNPRPASADSLHDVYPFSVEPCRALELVWPHIYGTMMRGNRFWLPLMPPKHSVTPWTPSLYLGGATLVLALGAARVSGASPWRGWMTVVAIVSVLAALGEYGSPLWWAREVPGAAAYLGGHDIHDGVNPFRLDGTLQDGDGGLYWLLTVVLPGFRVFRYPGKLLTFTSLALSVLAGIGCGPHRCRGQRRSRRCRRSAAVLLMATLVVLGTVLMGSDRLAKWLETRASGGGSLMGPLDVPGTLAVLRGGLIHAAVLLSLLLFLLRTARRFPGTAAALVLPMMMIDLATANSALVLSLPQAVFDARPALLDVIDRAEKADPKAGPFRVYRLPRWDPVGWYETGSPDRLGTVVQWRRKTLEAKYGLPYGLEVP